MGTAFQRRRCIGCEQRDLRGEGLEQPGIDFTRASTRRLSILALGEQVKTPKLRAGRSVRAGIVAGTAERAARRAAVMHACERL